MRFTWASSSSLLSPAATTHPATNKPKTCAPIQPSKRAPAKKLNGPGRTLKRPRTRSRVTKHESVIRAKKREQVKTNVAKNQSKENNNRVEYSHVYVGNIESFITRERLESAFSSCGNISRIQIRCSRGQAITVGVAVPEDIRTSRDRQYASIEFNDSKAARNALRLNGSSLDGCTLVVSISAADLPEVQDIVKNRLGKFREKQGLPNPYKTESRPGARSIVKEVTEPLITSPPVDRHRLFGFSFAKCVV